MTEIFLGKQNKIMEAHLIILIWASGVSPSKGSLLLVDLFIKHLQVHELGLNKINFIFFQVVKNYMLR